MAVCSGIKADGGRCKAQPMGNSEWCYSHHPDHLEERRRHGSKGGKRGGRGRPSSELARLQHRLEELADDVLVGKVERADAAVVGQLLGGARSCIRDGLAAREQEEFAERMEKIEDTLEQRDQGAGSW